MKRAPRTSTGVAQRTAATARRSPTSCERMVSVAEYQRLSAKKIDQVPSVTMNGGSLQPRHQHAVDRAAAARRRGDADEERERRRQAGGDRELAHDHRAQHHDGADREIDAGGDHDQRLRDADDADDGHLLDDQRQVERST